MMEELQTYRPLSLFRLVELIARNGDRKALHELHNNRKVFCYHGDRPLRLAEFVDKLRQSKPAWRWCNANPETLEKAYDLTISKFSNLPNLNENGLVVKQQGPDCRYYYEAFISRATRTADRKSYYRVDGREKLMAELLQNLIVRHFLLSCLECGRRGTELTKRYIWKIEGHSMELFLPIDMPANQKGKWLVENIPDADPTRPGERDRIQAIVDGLTRKRRILSLENIEENAIATDSPPAHSEIEQEITVRGLANVVADEKAENIDFQRDAIRQLGKRKLRQLIRQIFDGLACGRYEVMKIADSFGINRSTFSRFAGSNWLSQMGKSQDYPTPDLWFNTAETLAGHPLFVRIAEDASILDRLKKVLQGENARRRHGDQK